MYRKGGCPYRDAPIDGETIEVALGAKPKGAVVIGIDPGISGALVMTNGRDFLRTWLMPVTIVGREKTINFRYLQQIFSLSELDASQIPEVFVERAVPMAMGAKSAFSYGRGFEALVLAVQGAGLPMTMVEPQKWTKEMHQGISQDLKPKARSLVAVRRLFPRLVELLPTKPKGGLLDGPVDALLIAGYGLRRLPRLPVHVNCRSFVRPILDEDDVGDFL